MTTCSVFYLFQTKLWLIITKFGWCTKVHELFRRTTAAPAWPRSPKPKTPRVTSLPSLPWLPPSTCTMRLLCYGWFISLGMLLWLSTCERYRGRSDFTAATLLNNTGTVSLSTLVKDVRVSMCVFQAWLLHILLRMHVGTPTPSCCSALSAVATPSLPTTYAIITCFFPSLSSLIWLLLPVGAFHCRGCSDAGCHPVCISHLHLLPINLILYGTLSVLFYILLLGWLWRPCRQSSPPRASNFFSWSSFH